MPEETPAEAPAPHYAVIVCDEHGEQAWRDDRTPLPAGWSRVAEETEGLW